MSCVTRKEGEVEGVSGIMWDLYRECWSGQVKERGYLKDFDANARIVFKLVFNCLNTKINLY